MPLDGFETTTNVPWIEFNLYPSLTITIISFNHNSNLTQPGTYPTFKLSCPNHKTNQTLAMSHISFIPVLGVRVVL